MKLEICTGSYNSIKAAQEGGAQRIEICSGLDEGGLTPSAGLIKAACKLENIDKHVLIRPRGGDFLYNNEEKAIIIDDILWAKDLGVDGVVVGALKADGNIDSQFLKECVRAANGLHVTFHRAFDLCSDPFTALEIIKDAGCDRILTSGQASTAEIGIPVLRELVNKAGNDIIIMPGCRVSPANALKILKETGANEIHASARSVVRSKMQFRLDGVEMGKSDVDEYSIKETDQNIVKQISEQINLPS